MGKVESEIETYLVNRVAASGGIAYKFVSPGRRGVPDRLCLLPNGRAFFAELKSPDGSISVQQMRRMKEMESLGHEVYAIRSKREVDNLLRTSEQDRS